MTNRPGKICIYVSGALYGFIIAGSSSQDVAADRFRLRPPCGLDVPRSLPVASRTLRPRIAGASFVS
jgi:hypothetical protein